jgi:hypothetical protein
MLVLTLCCACTPCRQMLEEQMAVLEGGDRAFAFTSGMAALAAAAKLVKSGEHIVAGDDIYGGTSRLLSQVGSGVGGGGGGLLPGRSACHHVRCCQDCPGMAQLLPVLTPVHMGWRGV